MDKEKNTGRNIAAAGAAAALCGAALYATGQVLRFLFRDVDPDREKPAGKDPDANDRKPEDPEGSDSE